jgi:hypothetical protein
MATLLEKWHVTLVEKWHLAENGSITAWVPQKLHTSSLYSALRTSPLKPCYTGKTNGVNSTEGQPQTDDIEYEYTIPLTELKQRKVKWQWQGIYEDVIVEFGIEQHIYEYTYQEKQTYKQINDIINKLNEPPKAYYPHNFRLSEGVVLCQQCGEFLSDIKKTTFRKGCAKL